MAVFINTVTPELKIYNPVEDSWFGFTAGRLEIDEGDPNYQWALAEAQRNPAISVHQKATQCPECGDVFTGRMAAANLGSHRKEIHFDKWLADQEAATAEEREIQIKSREGYACPDCAPVQTFGTAEALALHVREIHAGAPSAAELESDGGGSGVDTDIPAATPSGS